MRIRAHVVALLTLPACISNLDVPSSALVTCSVTTPACPDGYVCDGGLGLCLPATPASGDGAAIAGSPSITPQVAGANRRIRVEFSTDHALVGSPALSIVSGAFAATLAYESGSGTGPYVFSYETTGGEAEGVATIRGTFADAQGRITRDAPIGTVELDYTAPIVERIDVDEAVVVGALVWVDTTAVTLRPVLPAGGEVPATASVDGDAASALDLAYAATIGVDLAPGDGSKLLLVKLADLAGNITAVPVAVKLDTALPGNSVVIDTPTPPEVFLNAASLTVFFHSSGAFPADFAGYAFSTDGGVTWIPTPTLGALALSTLAQDTTTTLWVRERDVFGNMTAIAAQGSLDIHEDSQAPSAPKTFTNTVSGFLGSEVGLLLDGSRDPGGGEVTYEVSGGPFGDYTAVGTEPRIILPAAATGSTTVYVIRAVDRAGNPSAGITMTVADTPFAGMTIACGGACFLYDFYAGSNAGVFAALDPSPADNACAAGSGECRSQSMWLCRANAVDEYLCSSKSIYVTRSTSQIIQGISIAGSVITFTDISNQLNPIIRAMAIGADLDVGTGDDGSVFNVAAGNCQVGTAQGVFYGASGNSNRLTFYNYGNDRIPGTADTGEAGAVVVAASVVSGFNPCRLQSSPRHVLWRDGRSGIHYYVFNLGADGKPGGGDDAGEWLVPDGDGNGTLLGTNRVLVHQANGDWKAYGAGLDQIFGNGDDGAPVVYNDLPQNLSDVEGDRAYSGTPDVMYDLTTHATLSINNQNFGGTDLGSVFASGAVLFGGLSVGPTLPTQPGAYSVQGRPLAYQVANRSGEGPPSGIVDGDLYAFLDGATAVPTLLNLAHGGRFVRPPASAELVDMDIDGNLFVWVDKQAHKVMVYDAGADATPGTADDRGPAEVTSSAGTYRWPRVDAGVIVYGDMSADADGFYFGTDIVCSLKTLDLGADGWVGGGDDVAATLATGTKGIMPDISQRNVVYFDYANDATGLCEGSRGSAPAVTSCTPSLKVIAVGGASPTTIVAGGAARADLRIDGNLVLWSEYGTSWNIRQHTLGGATIDLLQTSDDERMPMRTGTTLAYYVDDSPSRAPGTIGVFVRESGPDVAFGTSDDIVLHQPLRFKPISCGDCTAQGVCGGCGGWDGRMDWFDGEVTATGGGLMPAQELLDLATGASGLAIPDNGLLTDSVTLTVPSYQTLEDLRLRIALTHPTPSQLELRLVSPRGERVVLTPSVTLAGPSVSTVYDITNAPELFNVYGESLAGVWQLEVADKVSGGTGTLTSWRLEHRR